MREVVTRFKHGTVEVDGNVVIVTEKGAERRYPFATCDVNKGRSRRLWSVVALNIVLSTLKSVEDEKALADLRDRVEAFKAKAKQEALEMSASQVRVPGATSVQVIQTGAEPGGRRFVRCSYCSSIWLEGTSRCTHCGAVLPDVSA